MAARSTTLPFPPNYTRNSKTPRAVKKKIVGASGLSGHLQHAACTPLPVLSSSLLLLVRHKSCVPRCCHCPTKILIAISRDFSCQEGFFFFYYFLKIISRSWTARRILPHAHAPQGPIVGGLERCARADHRDDLPLRDGRLREEGDGKRKKKGLGWKVRVGNQDTEAEGRHPRLETTGEYIYCIYCSLVPASSPPLALTCQAVASHLVDISQSQHRLTTPGC